jgi:hypothetical protein
LRLFQKVTCEGQIVASRNAKTEDPEKVEPHVYISESLVHLIDNQQYRANDHNRSEKIPNCFQRNPPGTF